MKINKHFNSGFTLIEILVVVTLIGVLGVIFSDTLTQILRGQSKVKVVNQVKQNGQEVLNKLSFEIRQAEKVICVGVNESNSGGEDDTIVIFRNGQYSRFRFYRPGFIVVTKPCGTDNGCIIRNDFTGDNIVDLVSESTLCSELVDRDSQKTYLLTDTDPINGVSLNYARESGVEQPVFQKNPQEGFNNIVTIKFIAREGVGAGQTYESKVGPEGILFTTSVQARGGK